MALVAVVRAPERPRPESERGHRIFPIARAAVRGVDLMLQGDRLQAQRTPDGWDVDGRPATPGTDAALDDLVATLLGLRAVDVFRDRDGASYGLDRPRATIDLETSGGPRRLVIGDPNATGGSFYARRVGDARILQVGALLLTEVGRVFYNRNRSPS